MSQLPERYFQGLVFLMEWSLKSYSRFPGQQNRMGCSPVSRLKKGHRLKLQSQMDRFQESRLQKDCFQEPRKGQLRQNHLSEIQLSEIRLQELQIRGLQILQLSSALPIQILQLLSALRFQIQHLLSLLRSLQETSVLYPLDLFYF